MLRVGVCEYFGATLKRALRELPMGTKEAIEGALREGIKERFTAVQFLDIARWEGGEGSLPVLDNEGKRREKR